MTVKFLHVRLLDDNGVISERGGFTVAYTCTDKEICYQMAECHINDHFCYETGRKIAEGRLKSTRPSVVENIQVIPLTHPITSCIIDHIGLNHYTYPILIYLDEKHRWVSDFSPFDPTDEVPEFSDDINLQIAAAANEGMQHDILDFG